MSGADVFVRAVGAVTSAGTGIEALRRAFADDAFAPTIGLPRPDAAPLTVATCADFNPRDHLPPLVARRLDRPARMLAVAAREAIRSLGETPPWPPDRVGLSAGTWNSGTSALVEVLRAVFLGNPDEAPPAQFPSTVANAPASQIGILERFGGPNLTFAEKQVGGLRAVAEAGRFLGRGRADAALACGVDEAEWLNAEGYHRLGTLRRPGHPGMVLGEGAAVLMLAREPGPDALARVAGWGSASAVATPWQYPEDGDGVVVASCNALAMAGLGPEDVAAVCSFANGIPLLDALEQSAYIRLFGDHRPAVFDVARLGEGAFAGALRVVTGALLVAGQVMHAWRPPAHLAAAGFRPLHGAPRSVLVAGLAGGGSAVAIVLTAA